MYGMHLKKQALSLDLLSKVEKNNEVGNCIVAHLDKDNYNVSFKLYFIFLKHFMCTD